MTRHHGDPLPTSRALYRSSKAYTTQTIDATVLSGIAAIVSTALLIITT